MNLFQDKGLEMNLQKWICAMVEDKILEKNSIDIIMMSSTTVFRITKAGSAK